MNLLEKCINFSKIKSSQLIFNTKIVKNKNKKDLEEERKLEEVAFLNEDAKENTNKIVKETTITPKNNDISIKEVTKQSQKLLKPFSINRTTELMTTINQRNGAYANNQTCKSYTRSNIIVCVSVFQLHEETHTQMVQK